MEQCEKIQEMLIPYLNRFLTDSECSMVITHIAHCKDCKDEVALLIKLDNVFEKTLVEVPKDIQLNAFDKIKMQEIKEVSIFNSDVLKTIINKNFYSPMLALYILSFALLPIKKLIKLALDNV